MKGKLISGLISGALGLVIFALILVNIASFISGPARIQEQENRNAVALMLSNTIYQSAQLINRFSFDQVYYFAQADSMLICFLADGTILNSLEMPENTTLVTQWAVDQQLDPGYTYGYYDHAIVYVLSSPSREVFLRLQDLQIVFDFMKEVS